MAATTFPFSLVLTNLKNASGNIPRINIKNDGQYNTSSQINLSGSYVAVQGYSNSVGDGGKATIDGALSTVTLFNLNSTNQFVCDLIVQNNGTTGTSRGFLITSGNSTLCRCIANNIRGNGFHTTASGNIYIECEAYSCNKANTAGDGGFRATAQQIFINCVSHDNSGSGADGFCEGGGGSGSVVLINCIADSNGRHGFASGFGASHVMINCDSYNNGADGLKNTSTNTDGDSIIKNCNFIKNTGWAVNSAFTTGRWLGTMDNCGFGAGTQANGNGTTNGTDGLIISGSITYGNDVTPWMDPANGDFRISLATARGSGRGAFTQTASSYTGTIGYPDVGSAQHRDVQKSSTFGG